MVNIESIRAANEFEIEILHKKSRWNPKRTVHNSPDLLTFSKKVLGTGEYDSVIRNLIEVGLKEEGISVLIVSSDNRFSTANGYTYRLVNTIRNKFKGRSVLACSVDQSTSESKIIVAIY